MKRVGRAYF